LAKLKKYVVVDGSTYIHFNNDSDNNNIRLNGFLFLLIHFGVLPIHHNGMKYKVIIIIIIINFKISGIS